MKLAGWIRRWTTRYMLCKLAEVSRSRSDLLPGTTHAILEFEFPVKLLYRSEDARCGVRGAKRHGIRAQPTLLVYHQTKTASIRIITTATVNVNHVDAGLPCGGGCGAERCGVPFQGMLPFSLKRLYHSWRGAVTGTPAEM